MLLAKIPTALSPDIVIFLEFLIVIFPWSNCLPNSFSCPSLFANPRIPTDWFPPTLIFPAFLTIEPFTAYTPTAFSFALFPVSFSTLISEPAVISTTP